MKRLLQFVAAVLVAFLAVPMSSAEGICFMLQPAQSAAMPGCCAAMQQGSMPAMAMPAAGAATLQMQSCNGSCCSVSRQNLPAQTAQERAKSTSAQPFSALPAAQALSRFEPGIPVSRPPDSSPAPRHILLRTLRI